MNLKSAFLSILFVIIIHFFAILFNLYEIWQWFDVPMHFAGGLSMGFLGIAIWRSSIKKIDYQTQISKILKWAIPVIFIFGFVSLIGILWELHEFVLDAIFGTGIDYARALLQPSLQDTMTDLLMDLIGALAASIICYRQYVI